MSMYNPFLFDQMDPGLSFLLVPAPQCERASKHFFKLENKIALLKEVIAVNPFEDHSRWRIVSNNYNIWTAAHQPNRYYAAADYLPRKVREMVSNYTREMNGEQIDVEGEDEDENNELRSLLAEVYLMVNNASKADRAKRKKLKLETPKTVSPERLPRSRTLGLDTLTLPTPQIHSFTPEVPQMGFDINLGFNRVLEPILARLLHLETRLIVIENINRNNLGLPANVVPFVDGLRPGIGQYGELPLLYTALDVENLLNQSLDLYCRAYGLGLDGGTSDKKRRLAVHVGILSPDNYSERG